MMGRLRNERGIALLIVLLVTALLIALVFEFAYATRISLNSAVNFRDSQRAYFLALSGINAFKTNGAKLRDMIPAGEWHPVPMIEEGDTVIMVRWEDESGKIRVNGAKNDPATRTIVTNLFEIVNRIDTTVIDRMTADDSELPGMRLLSALHQFMSNEDYAKVEDALTMEAVGNKINVNYASSEVLQSLGISAYDAEVIVKDRQVQRYEPKDLASNERLGRLGEVYVNDLNLFSYLTTESVGFYKVYAYATVGGYTKHVEAILNGNVVTYWKAL